MGEKYQDKWIDFLPFMMLGKNVALQSDIGASASELSFGLKVRVPGQILHDPGDLADEEQLQKLLEDVRNKTDIQAHQTSRHNPPEKPLKSIPDTVTHVYTKQHHTKGLQCPFEGPFLIESRPSKSTVRIEVGSYSDGRKRYEVRHLNDLKLAHEDSPAAVVQRPKLGRPSSKTSTPSNVPDSTEFPNPPSMTVDGSKQTLVLTGRAVNGTSETISHETSNLGGDILASAAGGGSSPPLVRPVRSTRNPNPSYVD